MMSTARSLLNTCQYAPEKEFLVSFFADEAGMSPDHEGPVSQFTEEEKEYQ